MELNRFHVQLVEKRLYIWLLTQVLRLETWSETILQTCLGVVAFITSFSRSFFLSSSSFRFLLFFLERER